MSKDEIVLSEIFKKEFKELLDNFVAEAFILECKYPFKIIKTTFDEFSFGRAFKIEASYEDFRVFCGSCIPNNLPKNGVS